MKTLEGFEKDLYVQGSVPEKGNGEAFLLNPQQNGSLVFNAVHAAVTAISPYKDKNSNIPNQVRYIWSYRYDGMYHIVVMSVYAAMILHLTEEEIPVGIWLPTQVNLKNIMLLRAAADNSGFTGAPDDYRLPAVLIKGYEGSKESGTHIFRVRNIRSIYGKYKENEYIAEWILSALYRSPVRIPVAQLVATVSDIFDRQRVSVTQFYEMKEVYFHVEYDEYFSAHIVVMPLQLRNSYYEWEQLQKKA